MVAVFFAYFALISIAAGVLTVALKNPVHCGLALLALLLHVSGLFVLLNAEFLWAVQVIVYAGAIVVLFLFVIMLLGVDREENVALEELRAQRPIALLLGVIAMAEIILLTRGTDWVSGASSTAGVARGRLSNVETLARSIFDRYLLAFEVTSVLLVIAVVGAVVLTRRLQDTGAEEQR